MSRFLAVGLAAGCITTVGIGAQPAELRLPVCVYNSAGVDEEVLAGARRVAGRVFRELRVELEWIDCQTADLQRSSPVYLRLLSAPMAQRLPSRSKEFGFALLSRGEGQASNAYIFYHKVEEIAGRETVFRPELLGQVLAHEMGHLLLGTNSHSNVGIMRSLWDRQTLEQVNQRRLFFTTAEAKKIQSEVRNRMLPLRPPPDAIE